MYKVLYHTLSKKYITSITKGQPPTLSVSLALTVSIKRPVQQRQQSDTYINDIYVQWPQIHSDLALTTRVLHSAKFQIRVYEQKIQ